MAALSVPRRLRSKQRAPACYLLPPAALRALADEAWSEVTALAEDARRKHVHWTHIRTTDPTHRQPESFTREEFTLFLGGGCSVSTACVRGAVSHA